MFRFLLFMLAVAISASPASAATFGDMFNSVGASVAAGGAFMRVMFAVLGFACIGGGVFLLVNPREFGPQNSPFSELFAVGKVITILAGAALLKLAFFAEVATSSLGLS